MMPYTLLLFNDAAVQIFLLSGMLCALVVVLSRVVPRLRGRAGDLAAKQTAHRRPTARIGGVAIFAALCLSVIFAPEGSSDTYVQFIAATGFVFLVGLSEDLGFHVSPAMRLTAAFISSLLVILLLDVWLPRTDIPALDNVMHCWFVGVPLTLLVTAGLANGFNLIDGVNGLAALTGLTASVALTAIAAAGGYADMVVLAPMVAVAVLGFAVLNFPFGLIFLGDAGAYTLGFVLSWFGIAILLHVPEASAWAILLVMFWPIADTVLAIHRRFLRGADAMRPDRLHMHQLVMRGLEICWLGSDRRLLANSLTTVVLAPCVIMPAVAGVIFWDRPVAAGLSVLVFSLLFLAFYQAGYSAVRRFRRRSRVLRSPKDRPPRAAERNTISQHPAE